MLKEVILAVCCTALIVPTANAQGRRAEQSRDQRGDSRKSARSGFEGDTQNDQSAGKNAQRGVSNSGRSSERQRERGRNEDADSDENTLKDLAAALNQLEAVHQDHIAVLSSLLNQVPESARPKLQRAIQNSKVALERTRSAKKRAQVSRSQQGRQAKRGQGTDVQPVSSKSRGRSTRANRGQSDFGESQSSGGERGRPDFSRRGQGQGKGRKK